MNNYEAIWNWLDGKKTAFGLILLIICGAPHLDKWISSDVLEMIYYFGSILGAGGVVHRIRKSK